MRKPLRLRMHTHRNRLAKPRLRPRQHPLHALHKRQRLNQREPLRPTIIIPHRLFILRRVLGAFRVQVPLRRAEKLVGALREHGGRPLADERQAAQKRVVDEAVRRDALVRARRAAGFGGGEARFGVLAAHEAVGADVVAVLGAHRVEVRGEAVEALEGVVVLVGLVVEFAEEGGDLEDARDNAKHVAKQGDNRAALRRIISKNK